MEVSLKNELRATRVFKEFKKCISVAMDVLGQSINPKLVNIV